MILRLYFESYRAFSVLNQLQNGGFDLCILALFNWHPVRRPSFIRYWWYLGWYFWLRQRKWWMVLRSQIWGLLASRCFLCPCRLLRLNPLQSFLYYCSKWQLSKEVQDWSALLVCTYKCSRVAPKKAHQTRGYRCLDSSRIRLRKLKALCGR